MLSLSLFSASLLTFADFDEVPIIVMFLVGLLALGLLTIYFFKDWFFARQRVIKHQITAEFRPPLDLNPAEIGFVFTGNLDEKHFAGLLVHMAQRGIIHFRRHKGSKIVLPGPNHVTKLKYYEKLILLTVLENRNVSSENLVTYHRTIFTKGDKYKTLANQVQHTLQAKKFYNQPIWPRFLVSVLLTTLVSLFLLVWLTLIMLVLYKSFANGSSDADSLLSLVYSVFIYSALLFIPLAVAIAGVKYQLAQLTGRKWIAQAKFKKFWTHIISFRQYVVLSEHGKLKFDEESLRKKSSINTLPYAIALGHVDNWRDIVY